MDFKSKYDELAISLNPFAIVILSHLATLDTKRLYDKGWDKDAILKLYKFIDWIMLLPEPLELEYHNAIEHFEQERDMTYITTAERIGNRKFGNDVNNYQRFIEQANNEQLLDWAELLIAASSLDEIFLK
jgi:hypothetical protein